MPTALIVEDDREQAEVLAHWVRDCDYRPAAVHSGAEALAQARTLRPDLILLDLKLPDIDGFEVCRRLRADEATRPIPIVMVTALDGDADRLRGFRVGADAYVAKPFDFPALAGAIADARAWKAGLEQARIRGEIRLELGSEAAFLEEVNDFLARLLAETPLTPDQISQLRQAVMEMGLNAIEWGHGHRAEEMVQITYRVYSDRVEVVVRDQGPGFDPADVPHAAGPDDPLAHMDVREKLGLREGGFGVMISRGMVDAMRYNERGNEVTLIKRFPPAPAPAPRPSRRPRASGA